MYHSPSGTFTRKNIKINGTEGKIRVPHYEIECATCNQFDRVKVSTNAGTLPEQVLNKQFSNMGWIVGKSKKNHACPKCRARLADARKKQRELKEKAKSQVTRTYRTEMKARQDAIQNEIIKLRELEEASDDIKLLGHEVPAGSNAMRLLMFAKQTAEESAFLDAHVLNVIDMQDKLEKRMKKLQDWIHQEFSKRASNFNPPIGGGEELARAPKRRRNDGTRLKMYMKGGRLALSFILGSDVVKELKWPHKSHVEIFIGDDPDSDDFGYMILSKSQMSSSHTVQFTIKPSKRQAWVESSVPDIVEASQAGSVVYMAERSKGKAPLDAGLTQHIIPNENEIWIRYMTDEDMVAIRQANAVSKQALQAVSA